MDASKESLEPAPGTALGGDGHPVEKARLRSFHELMPHRVQRILLLSSLYDSFILSEEGHLAETLLSHFIDLRLTNTPDLIQVPSAAEALEAIQADNSFDLIISSVHFSDGNAADLCAQLAEASIEVPVVALAYTSRELRDFVDANDLTGLEGVFLWQGDVRLLLAMVKCLEDRLNVVNDTGCCGVPAIILVEDNIRFYSSFLPAIYTELFRHTHQLLSEDLNLSQRMMRMRARPKVLLCTDFEGAWGYFEQYPDQVLGIVSDFEYERGGRLEKHAGLQLCSAALKARPDLRLVMQSSNAENKKHADELGASFLLKGSPMLLHELQQILVERFGFGDFIFRWPDGSEVDRAHDLKSLGEKLGTVPAESIGYHAERNHFSNWLKARTEFELAERLEPRRIGDYESVEKLRQHLLELVNESRLERHRSVIAEFKRESFEPTYSITRIGEGSLGGKARGVAFANRVLRTSGLDRRFPDVDVYVPPSVVLGTDIVDEFLQHLGLREFAIDNNPDEDILRLFRDAPFPRRAVGNLRSFLQRVRYPVAVRSSSLLEDSLSQPFAGVYQTFMLPNNDVDLDVRWMQLVNAIKQVYASAFTERAKTYLSMTSYRLEEEKMAVMIQELVGRQHGDRFYPDFAGVARSYNFYPEPGHAAEDGVAAVALGFGRTVVSGSPCLRFCPKYPRQIVSMSSVADALANSQRDFYALDLTRTPHHVGPVGLRKYPLDAAEEDGSLTWLGSTYSAENNMIVDGIARPGVRLVSFAQVLKHEAFPLAEILRQLLEECSSGTGVPVEIEFAGNLGRDGRRAQFAFLQLRPLALAHEEEEVEIGDVRDQDLICRSSKVLGNGRVDDIADIVVVDIKRFDRLKTPEVALEVARFDALLRKQGRPYLLIGVGRWGSADPSLGIPVGWSQIPGARVIIETDFEDIKVAPSQGTHFFQNLTSSNVGYFTVNPDLDEGFLDWDWLLASKPFEVGTFVRLVRLDHPLCVKMDGRAGEGAVFKPSPSG